MSLRDKPQTVDMERGGDVGMSGQGLIFSAGELLLEVASYHFRVVGCGEHV